MDETYKKKNSNLDKRILFVLYNDGALNFLWEHLENE